MSQIDYSYPIGRLTIPSHVEMAARNSHISQIATAPAHLRHAVAHLSDRQLDTPYRQGGWTVRQVVHHLPDSHVNAYIRFKFALTQQEPLIMPYDEKLWAELPEAITGPISFSLDLLESLHARWVACIRMLPPEAFARKFRHPEIGIVSIDQQLAMYAWHGQHHIAHITTLAAREGWTSG